MFFIHRQNASDNQTSAEWGGWDFGVDGGWHGRMAILRGVESGFSIVRAPKEGILSVSDNRGRVLAERSSDSSPFANLVAPAPVRH